MAASIGERFLGDAVDGVLQNRLQAHEFHVALEFDLGPAGLLLIVSQVGQGGHDSRLVEDRGADSADQPAGFEMRLPHHLHARVVGGLGVLGRGTLELLVGLELHHRGGQLLGQPVVDVVGDQLPFVIAGAEHVPERFSLPIDRFLGPRSFRVFFAQALIGFRQFRRAGFDAPFELPLHLHALGDVGNETLQEFHVPAVARHADAALPDPSLLAGGRTDAVDDFKRPLLADRPVHFLVDVRLIVRVDQVVPRDGSAVEDVRRGVAGQPGAPLTDEDHRPMGVVEASVGHAGEAGKQRGQPPLALAERRFRPAPLRLGLLAPGDPAPQLGQFLPEFRFTLLAGH